MGVDQMNKEQLAIDLAHRLRVIQLDCADETTKERQEYLGEEIERTLRRLAPTDRGPFLERLESQFPSWDGEVAAAASKSGTRSSVDDEELADASFLVSKLTALGPKLSSDERRVIRDRLVAAGIIEAAPKLAWEGDSALGLAEAVGVANAGDLDARRALSIVDALVDCVLKLNRLSSRTWQELAPKRKLRDPSRLSRDLGRFMAGDPEVSREHIAEQLEQLRGLVAAMVFGIKNGPREWAHEHLSTYGPPAVMGAVDAEGVKLLGNKEVKYWQKYHQLAGGLDDVTVAQQVLEVVAKFAERVMDSGRE